MTFCNIIALSADFSLSCDYAFMWLNKSSGRQNLHFSDTRSCIKHYVAKSVCMQLQAQAGKKLLKKHRYAMNP